MHSILKNISIYIIVIATFISGNSYAVSLYDDHSAQTDASNFVMPKIDPFEMSSWYFKQGAVVKLSTEKDYEPVSTAGDKKDDTDLSFLIWTVGMNKPVYDKYVSGGFNIASVYGSTKALGGVFLDVDAALSMKLTMPFDLGSAGNVALVAQGDAGLAFLLLDGESAVQKLTKDEQDALSEVKGIRCGGVAVASLGLEYYVTEWIGISAGWQMRYYQFGSSNITDKTTKEQFDRMSEAQKEALEESKKSYSKTINNIMSIGLSITF